MRVYIIHGWTYTLDKWQPICKMLEQKGIEPILLKVPGLTTPSEKIWDIDGYVTWLNEQLEGVQSPIVIGHSNGGRIALAYCQKYPSRFKKLILIGAAGVPRSKRGNAKVKILAATSALGKPLSRVPIFKKILYRIVGASDYNNAPPNMKKTMQNMLAADKAIDLAKVKVPVLLIWGKFDKSKPLADGKIMNRMIGNSSLQIIDGAGHVPHFTHAEEVLRIIEEFTREDSGHAHI